MKKIATFENIVSLKTYPINDAEFVVRCRQQLQSTGSLLLPGFISEESINILKQEALEHAHLAYYCSQSHTAYLSAVDPELPTEHARNRQVISSKGCITDDQIPSDSYLRIIYDHADFRQFLCGVLSEKQLYNYDDPLSSINVHYYQAGQELGWHFDNSSFAVTLMIQPSSEGGDFEYIAGLRNSESGDMNFDGVDEALRGKIEGTKLNISAGTLALFRGRNSLHRVMPVMGDKNRIQVVLAYNTEPGVALSEQARRTFYGRVA